MRKYDQVTLKNESTCHHEPSLRLNPGALANSDLLFCFLQNKIVLSSALAETFLRKLHKQKFIHYEEGTDNVQTKDDLVSFQSLSYICLHVKWQLVTDIFAILSIFPLSK